MWAGLLLSHTVRCAGKERELEPKDYERKYPGKFVPVERALRGIRKGDALFTGTGCGEPRYLVDALNAYVSSNPDLLFRGEQPLVRLGVAPYAEDRFGDAFHQGLFFIGEYARKGVNTGRVDYSPAFLFQVPDLLRRRLIRVDVALVQVSPPDANGYMSLGVSVDITRVATECARKVIAQVNPRMPRVLGDSFLHVSDVDCLVYRDEPLLEFKADVPGEIARRIGDYVARIVQDGDTIQVGYGSLPNAILASLGDKRHLGAHTELMTDGLAGLMRLGVLDNSRKSLNRGKTVASFCMGTAETYGFLGDNPSVEFRPIDYTNDPVVIAANDNMVAINSALAVDLTGQATAESLGRLFYSGVGGQADFMRGAVLSSGGRSIVVLPSTSADGKSSRIVPFLPEGAGITLTRGDAHYVVTEYGIAYLHGRNVRERALELIGIAHPDFRERLVEQARELRLVYADQEFVPGKEGEYPEELEKYRKTVDGTEILLRPVKFSDEPLLKDFFYSLSDRSNYLRFIMLRRRLPHEVLQKFVAIDYTRQMVILAVVMEGEKEKVVGVGQYVVLEDTHRGEIALAVRDEWQRRGIGTELMDYLAQIAKRQGLLGFTADVLGDNRPVMRLAERSGLAMRKTISEGVCNLRADFGD